MPKRTEKLELVENKVKDLLAECHEHGLQYAIAIVDPDTGAAINTMEGDGETALLSISVFTSRLVELSGLPVHDVMGVMEKATEAAIEVQKEDQLEVNEEW